MSVLLRPSYKHVISTFSRRQSVVRIDFSVAVWSGKNQSIEQHSEAVAGKRFLDEVAIGAQP